jgi:xanthine dehydrogenase YagS FAD-binding subunit
MRAFDYQAPATLKEAQKLIGGTTRPLAGGTDLLTLMKSDLVAPERLVAVRRLLPAAIEEVTDVQQHGGEVRIGAGATLAEVASHSLIADRYTALAEAASLAASPQLRHMATLGGNLLQRPRCWYFRNPNLQCWLKGGEDCLARDGENREHAIFDESPCMAAHPSDPATPLLAFDASVRLMGAGGERRLRLHELLALPEEDRRTETRLDDDELVLDIGLPALPDGTLSTYLKAMDRAAFSFALAGVAAVARKDAKGNIEHVRLVLGGVAPIPRRAQAAERILLGAAPAPDVLAKAADAAVDSARPLSGNGWKVPLVRALVLRALQCVVS